MKIRQGFVSNSSSASFTVPSFLLTDGQKEMILTLDDTSEEAKEFFNGLRTKKAEETVYPRNEEYHKIFRQMEKDDQWWDSWTVREDIEDGHISGGTSMDNGSLRILMEKIGIDLTAVEFCNDGHGSIHMATHPEAVNFFAENINVEMEKFSQRSEEEQEQAREFNFAPPSVNPYEAKASDFKTDWHHPYLEIDHRTFYKDVEK